MSHQGKASALGARQGFWNGLGYFFLYPLISLVLYGGFGYLGYSAEPGVGLAVGLAAGVLALVVVIAFGVERSGLKHRGGCLFRRTLRDVLIGPGLCIWYTLSAVGGGAVPTTDAARRSDPRDASSVPTGRAHQG